ncbi:MAG: ankyrin repeat domain-containing protein [Chloroflexota bacterium]
MLLVACTSIGVSTGSYPPFIQAVRAGDVAEADRLFRQGHLPGQTTIGNQTALHIAAAEGNDEMVRWLLAREAHPLAQDQNGRTPIDFAQRQGHTDTAQLILDYVDLVQREEEAIIAGDFETLRDLLAEDYRQNTLLHVLAQLGAVDELVTELETGVDVNAKNASEQTPLHKATIPDTPEAARLLLAAGADVNALNFLHNPPIYYAILTDNADMVALLLEAEADVTIRSAIQAETMIEYAERKNNPEIVNLFNQFQNNR